MDKLFRLSGGRDSREPVPTVTQTQAVEQSGDWGVDLGVSPGSSVSQQGDLGEALTLSTHFLLKTGARGAHHMPVLKNGHGV